MGVSGQHHAPAALYPRGKDPRYPLYRRGTGGWVGPRAGLDTEARGKILYPCRGSNPDRPGGRDALNNEAICTIFKLYTVTHNGT
jgi:hypothetical protein